MLSHRLVIVFVIIDKPVSHILHIISMEDALLLFAAEPWRGMCMELPNGVSFVLVPHINPLPCGRGSPPAANSSRHLK